MSSNQIAYFNGEFLPKDQIHISPDDRGFLFADGIYEVVRSYQGRLFRMEGHLNRLRNGLAALEMSPVDLGEMERVCQELIRRNDLEAAPATVYLQITRGAAPRLHRFPAPETPLTVYGFAKYFEPPVEGFEKGVPVITVADTRWARCDIKTVGLLPNALANQRAFAAGAKEAIFVRDGALLEGSLTSFLAVIGGKVVFPPLTNYTLPSITREVVMELCESTGTPYIIRPMFETEIPRMTEAMIVGTTTEVTPVVSMDGVPVGSGAPGPLTRGLQAAFAKLIE